MGRITITDLRTASQLSVRPPPNVSYPAGGSDGAEQALVAAAQQDRSAFGLLYRQYVTPIYRYFYQHTGILQDAEDLTGTTFSKALAGISGYKLKGSFAAWLFGIARRTLIDHQRMRQSHIDLNLVSEMLLDPTTTPETQVIQSEQARHLHRLIQQLPPDQQEALVLRYFGELHTREIALVLGRSEGAVRMLIHRAVATLRTHYNTEAQ